MYKFRLLAGNGIGFKYTKKSKKTQNKRPPELIFIDLTSF